MKKYALITVSDKTGVVELARGLQELGFAILSTSGTAKSMRDSGIDVTEVSDVTGFPEILDGRVKTLHPTIHAGILARREIPEHLAKLAELQIDRIDLVAVNLYPFEQVRKQPGATDGQIIENIDIGGPALLRAAAKNHQGVIVLTDPADYPTVLAALKDNPDLTSELRRALAARAFDLVSGYDAGIVQYLAGASGSREEARDLPASFALRGRLQEPLRYGENPHQTAGFYASARPDWQLLHGRELSFNNYQDIDAALRALRLFGRPTAVIVKHCNPCGLATADTLEEAYRKAFAADTQSPFGGIVGLNRPLDRATAQNIDQIFTEIVIAPGFEDGVLDYLRKKKNRRLIAFDPRVVSQPELPWETRQLRRGFLLQSWDQVDEDYTNWNVVTQRQPSSEEWDALRFAWKVVSLLRSNAIAITGAEQVFGLGSGQTSRIDSTCLAIWKARKFGHELSRAVCASDGFFPYPDSVQELAAAGVLAVIQPGGSKGDAEVIRACDAHAMAMVCTGFRHFRH